MHIITTTYCLPGKAKSISPSNPLAVCITSKTTRTNTHIRTNVHIAHLSSVHLGVSGLTRDIGCTQLSFTTAFGFRRTRKAVVRAEAALWSPLSGFSQTGDRGQGTGIREVTARRVTRNTLLRYFGSSRLDNEAAKLVRDLTARERGGRIITLFIFGCAQKRVFRMAPLMCSLYHLRSAQVGLGR